MAEALAPDHADIMSFDGQAEAGHFARHIDVPQIPGFDKPAAYVLTAVNKKFTSCGAYLHAIFHERVLAFITDEEKVAIEIQTFAAELIAAMKEPQLWTFHLQVKGVGALNRDQIKQLLCKFGEVTKIVFPPNSFSELYSDVALVHVKRERMWDIKDTTLQYRQYGHVFKASIAILNKPTKQAPKPRQQAGEAKGHGRATERKPSAESCRDHARGRCTRGATCRFSHAVNSNTGAGAGAVAGADAFAAHAGARALAGAVISAPRHVVVKANRTSAGAGSSAATSVSRSTASNTSSCASSSASSSVSSSVSSSASTSTSHSTEGWRAGSTRRNCKRKLGKSRVHRAGPGTPTSPATNTARSRWLR